MTAIITSNVTVPFQELSDPEPAGGTFQRDGGFTDTKFFICAWDDRLALAIQLLGGTTSSEGVNAFTLPVAHPDYPRARVTSVGPMKPFGKPTTDGGFVRWPQSIVTVTYSTGDGFTEDQEDNTPFLREDFVGGSETISLPGQYFWSAMADGVQENPLPQAAAPSHTIRGVTWQLTWLKLSSLPIEFLNLVGKCNSSEIISRRFGNPFAPETLLHGEPQISATFNPDGSYALTATLSLKYRPTGWNNFFGKPGDESNANPIYAQDGVTPLKPITPADFSPLYNL